MRRSILTVALCVGLVGCQTPYQEEGSSAVVGGVRAEQVGYDRYRVSALVNQNTPSSRVGDYLLLKAAQTAQSNGSRYFVREGDIQDSSQVATYSTPGMVNPNGFGGYTVTPASTSSAYQPGATVYIRLVKGSARPDGAIDSQEVLDTIGRRLLPKK
ncbi:CC0125/CC1285 family lipoprotein [Aureimonas phyllosphaerae]|uniref:CC0125/CC1285 family lipoprotein n=1 Tax=Aureimonas phyllosphaerae TaxID=1166078 RepID=UPI003A5C464A